LKPSNILINANCDIAICDFGLARGESSGDLTEYVVTRWYRPPELLSLTSHYSTAIDIWSMGLIFAELLFGRTLLPGKDYVAQLTLVVDLLGTPSDEDMQCLSEQARKFIAAQPKKPSRDFRTLFPKATNDGVDLLRRLLQFHPKNRPTTKQIFEHPYLSKFRDAAEEADAPATFEANIESNEGTTVEELRELLWSEITKRSEEVIFTPRGETSAKEEELPTVA
jgi:serine/threonine protein kinase